MENELNVRENKRGAFTLIEILIVMVLMAFLMSITMKLFSDTNKAKKILLMQDEMTKIAEGFAKYKADLGVSPYDIEALVVSTALCNSKHRDLSSVWEGPYYNGNIQLFDGATADGAGTVHDGSAATAIGSCSADGSQAGGWEDTVTVNGAVATITTIAGDIASGAFIDIMQGDTGGLNTSADTILIQLGKRRITDATNGISRCFVGVRAESSNDDYRGWIRAAASKMSGVPSIDLDTTGNIKSKAQYVQDVYPAAAGTTGTLFVPVGKVSCSKVS